MRVDEVLGGGGVFLLGVLDCMAPLLPVALFYQGLNDKSKSSSQLRMCTHSVGSQLASHVHALHRTDEANPLPTEWWGGLH